jgi:hypothetical protein
MATSLEICRVKVSAGPVGVSVSRRGRTSRTTGSSGVSLSATPTRTPVRRGRAEVAAARAHGESVSCANPRRRIVAESWFIASLFLRFLQELIERGLWVRDDQALFIRAALRGRGAGRCTLRPAESDARSADRDAVGRGFNNYLFPARAARRAQVAMKIALSSSTRCSGGGSAPSVAARGRHGMADAAPRLRHRRARHGTVDESSAANRPAGCGTCTTANGWKRIGSGVWQGVVGSFDC